MSSIAAVSSARWLWRGSQWHPIANDWESDAAVIAADSWLVLGGSVRGLELHRERFFAACLTSGPTAPPFEALNSAADSTVINPAQLVEFWAAMTSALPGHGDWFPKVELIRPQGGGTPEFTLVLRIAPARTRSVTVASHLGADPRTVPTVKGPDLLALAAVRAATNTRVGAEEAIILSPEGYLVEGAYSALVWWQGDELRLPPASLARVDSITAKSLVTLVQALGGTVRHELVRPGDLAERELWALSALHGIRIVTKWFGGPPLAEQPGRLATWRTRLNRLAHPIVTIAR